MSFFARLRALVRPPLPATPFAAGIAALDRRRFDEALAHFDAALADAGTPEKRAAIHNKRGIAHVHRGDRGAAIAAFVEAREADETFVPVIVNIGNMLFEDGALDEAIVHYEAALRLDDGYAPAHLNIGIAYKRLGRRGDAVRAFRRAGKLEGRFGRRTS